MSIFDLFFIVCFLASLVTLLTAVVTLIRGQRVKALKILKRFGICLAIYMCIVVVVALATPRRLVNLGEARCFDDWCISIDRAEHRGTTYKVSVQLSSRARRVAQRERGIRLFLTDSQGRRFDPVPDPSAIPMDVLLQPGQTVETQRSFTVPDDARDVGAAVVHEGSYCFPTCFIIGDEENPLHKRTLVPLR
jgi:hypothetical protein